MPSRKDQHTESIDNIRSDEVQEILNHVPNWMVRWGTALIFSIILMFIFLSWWVRYPDVIKGPLTLTTAQPPVRLISKADGEIQRLFVDDDAFVEEGAQLLEIKNPLPKEAVSYLEKLLPQLTAYLNDEIGSISFEDEGFVFGEVQQAYNSLKEQLAAYSQIRRNDYQRTKLRNLRMQIANHKRLAEINRNQLKLAEADLENATEKFQTDVSLFEEKIIAKVAFYERKEAFNQVKNKVESIKKALVQNDIAITDLENQQNEVSYQFSDQEQKLVQEIRSTTELIQNKINTWQQHYILSAPFEGKVSYLTSLHENQFVTSGTPLLSIIPENNEYEAIITLTAQGYGKVGIGQTVHIQLDNYPYTEYGQLAGIITDVSTLPNYENKDNTPQYIAKVELTNGLRTTYHKTIAYKPEMMGLGRIVVQDLRLLDRIFNGLRKLMDR